MSPSNPGAGDCAIDSTKACSGYNYHDRSQIDKRNGGYVQIGFLSNDGWVWETVGGIGVFYSRRVVYTNPAVPTYNRVMCDYSSGDDSYAQCQAVVL